MPNRFTQQQFALPTTEVWDKIYLQAPIGIAVIETDRNLVMVNNKFCSFLGYTEKEILGTNLSAITHPKDNSLEVSELNRVKSGLIPGFDIIKRLLTKNGSIKWVKQTLLPVRDHSNKIINYVLHILPLLNGEKGKLEQVQDKEIHIRPTLTIKEFVIDHWKSFVAGIIFFITTSIGVGVAFNTAVNEIERLKDMQIHQQNTQIRQQELIERLNDRLLRREKY